jgi:phosphoesterase RecJ-like protein
MQSKLKQAKNIALFTHPNADPDAWGSVGAMAHALIGMGKQCSIFLCEKHPPKFDFLCFPNVKYQWDNQLDFDLLVALDVSDTRRLGIYEEVFKAHQNTICIDHHASRTQVAKTELVDANASSTCEMIFDLFEQMQIELTPAIASFLYFGIVGDTGGFMHSSTTPKTHIIASKLISLGADFVNINQKMFFTKTDLELKQMQLVLQRVERFGNIAISYVLEKDKQGSDQQFNTSELVNMIKCAQGVEIAALIKQVKGKNFNVSLRSSENYDVSAFAMRFGGGGHKRASGMPICGSLAQVKKLLTKELIEFAKH